MNQLNYVRRKLLSRILGKGDQYVLNSYRKEGMLIGDNTHIFSPIISSEPYLISIGSYTTIATNVTMLTHDASVGVVMGRDHFSDMCGRITIGDHCFIGCNTTILPGVTIPNGTIVAAGSVVTKSIHEDGIVIGGNPAKKICSVEEYVSKNEKFFLTLHGKDPDTKKELILGDEDKLLVK